MGGFGVENGRDCQLLTGVNGARKRVANCWVFELERDGWPTPRDVSAGIDLFGLKINENGRSSGTPVDARFVGFESLRRLVVAKDR